MGDVSGRCNIFFFCFLASFLLFPVSSTSFVQIKGYLGCILRLRIAFDGLRFLEKKKETWVGAAPRRDGLEWIWRRERENGVGY